MAITIVSSPKAYVASDNPITWVFESNQTNQNNFRYRILTSWAIAGESLVQVGNDIVYPQVGARSFFDASAYARNRAQIVPLLNSIAYNSSLWTLQVQIIEEYGTPPTTQATSTQSVTVFKARQSDKGFIGINYPTDWRRVKYLTNRPRNTFVVPEYGDFPLSVLLSEGGRFQLTVLDNGIQLAQSFTTLANYLMANVNINPSIIAPFIGEPLNEFDEIRVVLESETISVNETISLSIYRGGCGKYWTLRWLNEYGAYDWFIFNHNLEVSAQSTDISFEKQFGNWNGNSFEYTLQNSGNHVVIVETENRGVLHSGWLTQEVQNWLVELYKSPKVDLIDMNGEVMPIRLTKRSSTQQQSRFEDLFMESVEFQFIGGDKSVVL
jgi:hypothetical protein